MTARRRKRRGIGIARKIRSPEAQACALEHLLYEVLILASALVFRDIRYRFSFFPKLSWGVPQIAQDVIRLKYRLLLDFLAPDNPHRCDMIATDFSCVPPDNSSEADRQTFDRLRSTVDTIHQGTIHLSWNRIGRTPAGEADRRQVDNDAVFLLGKAIDFLKRAIDNEVPLNGQAKVLFENVNRLHTLLLGTVRTVEGAAGQPPKRIDVEKVLLGDQRIEVVSISKRVDSTT